MKSEGSGSAAARQLAETELYRAGTTDAVTRLPSRLFFIDVLKIVLEQSRRMKAPGTFVMILLDGAWIAQEGEHHDRVAGAIARVLRRLTRNTDIVSRLAADRFGLYLTGTDLAGAKIFVERLRSGIAVASKALGTAGPVQACFGVAEAGGSAYRIGLLLQSADRAASQSKLVGAGVTSVASSHRTRA